MKRVGLVGCGHWGRYILRDLKSLGCDVSVVARSECSRGFARQYGADRIVDGVERLPAALDGFIVATPTSLHAETVAPLVPFGRPIFVEKPLTNDPASARRLVKLGGGLIFVMDKWRYHPAIEALRDLGRSGELGPVESIRSMRLGWANPHLDVDAAWILMPHDLSIVLEILGHVPDPLFAVAEYGRQELTGLMGVLSGTPKAQRPRRRPTTVERNTRYAGAGASPFCAPSLKVVVEVSARRVNRVRAVNLNFREGAAAFDDSMEGFVEIRRAVGGEARPDDPVERRAVSAEWPLRRELRVFIEYLEGGPPPKTSAAEGARIVEVIAGLRRLANA